MSNIKDLVQSKVNKKVFNGVSPQKARTLYIPTGFTTLDSAAKNPAFAEQRLPFWRHCNGVSCDENARLKAGGSCSASSWKKSDGPVQQARLEQMPGSRLLALAVGRGALPSYTQ